MNDQYDFWITMGVSALLYQLKGEAKQKFRKVTLKICKTAGVAFAGDPDFTALWKALAGSEGE